MKGQGPAGLALAISSFLSIAHAAEPVSATKIARESARLKALAEHLPKGSAPVALAREFKKLAEKGCTPDIRRGASFYLAGLQREHKNPKAAGRIYDEISRSVGDRWGLMAAVALGDMRREMAELDAAIEAYERILSKNVVEPEAVRAALGVGLVLEKRADKENARKALEHGKAVARQLYAEDRAGIADALRAIDAALRRLRGPRKPRKRPPADAARLLREGNAALAAKRYGPALGKYNELIEKFPESTEADEAGYRKGLALYLSNRPGEARKTWEAFLQGEAEGPWRGHALVGLSDVYLEHDLNAVRASGALRQCFVGIDKRLANWGAAEGEAWLRKAVVEYISNRRDECLAALDQAKRFRPAPEEIAKHGIPWGPGRLAARLREGEGITPALVRRGGPSEGRTALVLGDIYFEMQEYLKARRLLAMLNPRLKPITGEDLTEASWKKNSKHGGRDRFDPVEWLKELSGRKTGKAGIEGATLAQRAYARLREGLTYQHKLHFQGALPCYATFLSEFARTPWAPEGTLRAAYLMNQMPPGGRGLRLPLLNLLLARYPNSERACSAAFSRALTYERRGDYDTATRLFSQAMARYPTKQMRYLCKLRLAEIEKKMAESEEGCQSRRKGGQQ